MLPRLVRIVSLVEVSILSEFVIVVVVTVGTPRINRIHSQTDNTIIFNPSAVPVIVIAAVVAITVTAKIVDDVVAVVVISLL